jgi:carbamoyltransferase
MPVVEDKQLNQTENSSVVGLDKLRVVRSGVPAVTHVDYSVRLQTVTAERNGFFYDVVDAFDTLTGCPMIVNTSFNLRGEPIVCDHRDAYHCFLMSDIDVLVLGSCVVAKPGVDLDAQPLSQVELKGAATHA